MKKGCRGILKIVIHTKSVCIIQKLAPCIERGELEACVEEAAQLAREMGVDCHQI